MITQNPLGLPGAQNVKIWMARALVGLQPAPAQNELGGYRVSATAGLLPSVTNAGTRG
jgi:hypothetical protein